VNYVRRHPAEIAFKLLEHVELTGLALLLALLMAVPLGVVAARSRRFGGAILGVLNVLYTVPSLALLALLIPRLGIGFRTAVVALVLYAQLILVRAVATGLRNVPQATREAALGLGLSPGQLLRRVELPLALPIMLGGLRVAIVSLISLANLAAWIAAGGLGDLILYGLEHDDPSRAVVGAALSSALAIGATIALWMLERRVAGEARGVSA